MSRLTPGRIFLVVGLVIIAGLVWSRIVSERKILGVNSPYVVSTLQCTNSTISLEFSIKPNWLEGDSVDYSLNYINSSDSKKTLYLVPLPQIYSYDSPSTNFESLPTTSNTPVTIIELPSKTRQNDWASPTAPPLMDIFLNPKNFSQQDYETISSCLKENASEINSKLRILPSLLPERDRMFYNALRLGGVVYGLPQTNN